MPRDSVLITGSIDVGAALQTATAALWRETDLASGEVEPFTIRLLDGGAAAQVLIEDVVVVTVLRPRPLPSPQEVERILPGTVVDRAASSWTEAYTTWHPLGRIGMRILDEMATSAGGIAIHHDLAAHEIDAASSRGATPE